MSNESGSMIIGYNDPRQAGKIFLVRERHMMTSAVVTKERVIGNEIGDSHLAAPLKVTLAIIELDISGGTQRQFLKLAGQLQTMGHNVTVVAARYDADLCFPDLCQGLNIVTAGRDASSGRRWHLKLLAARRFAEILASIEANVINFHGHRGIEFTDFLPPGTSVVWTPNDAPRRNRRLRDALCGKVFPGSFLAAFSARFDFYRRSARSLARLADIVLLDERNKEILRRNTGRDGCVIRSGVEPTDPDLPNRNPPDASQALRLLSIGIMFPHRRFEDLIRAVEILKRKGRSVSVRIVGRFDTHPDYAAQIRRLVSELGLTDEVEFIECVSDTELTALYRWAHVFVFPHAPQTWGLSPFEAMANGTPVLVTTGCGASEVIRNGEQGMVVDPFAPEQIAGALDTLDPETWRRLRARGLEMVAQEITWERFATDMTDVFCRATAHQKKTGHS